MSATTSYANGILTTQYDYSKLFVWDNRYRTATYTNTTGSTVTLNPGTILGRIFASHLVVPQVSTATDGSQIPMGILRGTYVVANNASVTVTYCYSGDIDTAGVVFGGSDTINTPILFNSSVPAATTTQYGTIEDILVGKGINPVTATDNTHPDN